MATLAELSIRKLEFPPSGREKHLDDNLPGFGICSAARTNSFFLTYGAEWRLKTLGKRPFLSLKDARAAARQWLAVPSLVRAGPKFGEVRARFLADGRQRLRPSTVERYHFALTDFPDVGLEKVSTEINDPNQIKTLKAMFNWAIEHGLADTDPFLRRLVQFAVRDRLITDEEAAAIWAIEQPPFFPNRQAIPAHRSTAQPDMAL